LKGESLNPSIAGPSVKQMVSSNRNYKSGNMSLYLDGRLISTNTSATGRLQATQDPLIVGANSNTTERFNGSIDEFKIYSRALSSKRSSKNTREQYPTGIFLNRRRCMEADKAIDSNAQTRWASQWSDPSGYI